MDYEVGDTWKAKNKNGGHGKVWLDKIDGNIEIWKWRSSYKDGSGLKFDWATNKTIAVRFCKEQLEYYCNDYKTKIRFKKQKGD